MQGLTYKDENWLRNLQNEKKIINRHYRRQVKQHECEDMDCNLVPFAFVGKSNLLYINIRIKLK